MELETKIPKEGNYPEFYKPYISRLDDDDLIGSMVSSHEESIDLFGSYPEEKWEYRYAAGKWNLKEMLAHLCDAERIFSIRALRFARNDQAPLPGFDQDDYIMECPLTHRPVPDLLEELSYIRKTTVKLFENFTPEMLQRIGSASGWPISVIAIGFIIVGHEKHHQNIFRERYF
ncbi:MAG: DNA damage-inducible protein DinB [Cyclobacteriaceae bacterium]|nr:MAG: DNA damage-inducible protein DinB [Cyclobacteriaceae bacterium]